MPLPSAWPTTGFQIESGQAHIFQVRRLGDDRAGLYALKRLKNPRRSGRFMREVQTMRHLQQNFNAAVPPVVDWDLGEHRPWFVMPWYEGGSLEAAVQESRFSSDPAGAIERLIQVGRVLDTIHEAGYAHRDLKPANVLVDGASIVLTDFGLCIELDDAADRLTQTAEAVGSRHYIAPENEGGMQDRADQRPADFYAFGKMMWALLAGRSPLPREDVLNEANVLAATLQDSRFRPLDDLLRDLLNRDPRLRLCVWHEVLMELSAVMARLEAHSAEDMESPPSPEAAVAAARRLRDLPTIAIARAATGDRRRSEEWFRETHELMQHRARQVEASVSDVIGASQGVLHHAVSGGSPPTASQLEASGETVAGPVRPSGLNAIIFVLNSGENLEILPTMLLRMWLTEEPDGVRFHRRLMLSPGEDPEFVAHYVPALSVSTAAFPLRRASTVDAAMQFIDEAATAWVDTIARYVTMAAEGIDVRQASAWQTAG